MGADTLAAHTRAAAALKEWNAWKSLTCPYLDFAISGMVWPLKRGTGKRLRHARRYAFCTASFTCGTTQGQSSTEERQRHAAVM